jgi:uncharacterized protein YuzE
MKKKTDIHYDSKNDVMYISFGEPTPSYSDELADGIYLRYDMITDEISGITIMDFSKRQTELNQLYVPFDISFDKIREEAHLN